MNYLYHFAPKNLRGHILYPLNRLKEVYPEIYIEQVKKYIGRERMLESRVPFLECLWNDVLHFSAVDPKEIKQALLEAGTDFSSGTVSYYQVDPNLLDSNNTIVWLYTSKYNQSNIQDFEHYNPGVVAKYSVMPEKTKAYYKEKVTKGERPLLHHDIPHILYKGILDVSDIPIINL